MARHLQKERHHRQGAEQDQVRQEPADDAGAERSPGEQAEVEHRRGRPAFAGHEQPEQGGRPDEEANDQERTPTVPISVRDGEQQGRHGGEEHRQAGPVEGPALGEVPAARDEQPRQDGAHQTEGNVDEKDEPPTAEVDQQPAQGWSEGQAESLGRTLDAEGTTELAPGDGADDDSHAVGRQHGRPRALDEAEGHQDREVGRQAAQGRAGDEDQKAIGVEEFAPDHVGVGTDGAE